VLSVLLAAPPITSSSTTYCPNSLLLRGPTNIADFYGISCPSEEQLRLQLCRRMFFQPAVCLLGLVVDLLGHAPLCPRHIFGRFLAVGHGCLRGFCLESVVVVIVWLLWSLLWSLMLLWLFSFFVLVMVLTTFVGHLRQNGRSAHERKTNITTRWV